MLILCILLMVACVWDYSEHRIPNWLTLIIFVAGIFERILNAFPGAYLELFMKEFYLLIGLVLFFYPFFKIGTIGAGDVKLIFACSIYFSPTAFLYFLFLSMLISAIISVIKMISMKNFKERINYFFQYLEEVVRNRAFGLYICNEFKDKRNSVCLAGPICICAVLMTGGGI